jgi:hypothetical protein
METTVEYVDALLVRGLTYGSRQDLVDVAVLELDRRLKVFVGLLVWTPGCQLEPHVEICNRIQGIVYADFSRHAIYVLHIDSDKEVQRQCSSTSTSTATMYVASPTTSTTTPSETDNDAHRCSISVINDNDNSDSRRENFAPTDGICAIPLSSVFRNQPLDVLDRWHREPATLLMNVIFQSKGAMEVPLAFQDVPTCRKGFYLSRTPLSNTEQLYAHGTTLLDMLRSSLSVSASPVQSGSGPSSLVHVAREVDTTHAVSPDAGLYVIPFGTMEIVVELALDCTEVLSGLDLCIKVVLSNAKGQVLSQPAYFSANGGKRRVRRRIAFANIVQCVQGQVDMKHRLPSCDVFVSLVPVLPHAVVCLSPPRSSPTMSLRSSPFSSWPRSSSSALPTTCVTCIPSVSVSSPTAQRDPKRQRCMTLHTDQIGLLMPATAPVPWRRPAPGSFTDGSAVVLKDAPLQKPLAVYNLIFTDEATYALCRAHVLASSLGLNN